MPRVRFICVCLLAGCAGATTYEEQLEALTEITTLRVEGHVAIGASAATDVRVTGHCGQQTYEAETDQNGDYALEVEVEGCDQLVIEHDKEAFLPQYSMVPIPPPASPIRIAIALEEMEVLECGHEVCHTESGTDLPSNDAIARGYQISMSGTDALAFVPPDFRTAEGELVSFLGFHYLEFRDVDGALLPEVPEIDVCARVSEEALNWVGDIDPSTDAVELAWYRYDPAHASWEQSGAPAKLKFERGNVFERDEDGECVDVRDDLNKPFKERIEIVRDELPDVRADEYYVPDPCADSEPPRLLHIRKYWICGPMDRGGFYGFGLNVPQTSCYALAAQDNCGEPMQNASFVLEGTDHGFRAQAWTGPDGKACIDVMASEPIGEDFDRDALGGETFWVDLDVRNMNGARANIDMHENERAMGSCEQPESCIQLRTELRGCEE